MERITDKEWEAKFKDLSIKLTDGETAMFEHLSAMETVHNELGKNLSIFKDQIMQSRNEFVGKLCAKYRISKPNFVTYDPVTHSIVSIFGAKLHTVYGQKRPAMFIRLAQDLIFKAIETLTAFHKSTNGRQ